MKDKLTLNGWVELEARDASDNLIGRRYAVNLFLNQGRSRVANLIGKMDDLYLAYLGVGTDGTAPAAADTTLGGFVGSITPVRSIVTTAVAGDTLQLVGTISITSATTLREAGIIYKLTPLLITNRVTYADLVMPAGSAITITWKLQIT